MVGDDRAARATLCLPMTIVLVSNPRAGRGRARRLFDAFHLALEHAGTRTIPLTLGHPATNGSSADSGSFDADRFKGATAIVAFGGDGTLNAIAGPAAATGTPVYHVPAGNENLFARAFGMDRNPQTLERALSTHRVTMCDTAACDGTPFLIMAGFGPDAGVIRRLHHARTRALGHLAYAEPVLREAVRPTLQPLTITVDGREMVSARTGWLVVGNVPEYASRIDFCSRAHHASGTLDAVFMPATNIRDCANWVLRARLRQHRRDARLVAAQGSTITVRSDNGPLVHQIDGEWCDEHAASANSDSGLTLTVHQQRLPVLLPV